MISSIAYIILKCIGYQPFNIAYIDFLTRYPRAVLVMSHTSYWDFFIFILYKFAYPDIFRSFYIIVAGRFFDNKIQSKILTYFGCIPGNRTSDTKNGGLTSSIIDTMKTKNTFHLMLSPKGGITKRPWRSGYYYIAQALNVPIGVVGIDYKQKCLRVVGIFPYITEINLLEPQLQQCMSEITPRNTHYGYY